MTKGHVEPSWSFSKNNRAIIELKEGARESTYICFNIVPPLKTHRGISIFLYISILCIYLYIKNICVCADGWCPSAPSHQAVKVRRDDGEYPCVSGTGSGIRRGCLHVRDGNAHKAFYESSGDGICSLTYTVYFFPSLLSKTGNN